MEHVFSKCSLYGTLAVFLYGTLAVFSIWNIDSVLYMEHWQCSLYGRLAVFSIWKYCQCSLFGRLAAFSQYSLGGV